MIDRAIDGRSVILPRPDKPHAFQRSPLNLACTVCAGRRRNPIHPPEARFTF